MLWKCKTKSFKNCLLRIHSNFNLNICIDAMFIQYTYENRKSRYRREEIKNTGGDRQVDPTESSSRDLKQVKIYNFEKQTQKVNLAINNSTVVAKLFFNIPDGLALKNVCRHCKILLYVRKPSVCDSRSK